MIAVISILVFAGAGIVALSLIGYTIATRWRQMTDAARGHPVASAQDRWRSVHLAADRRRPIHEIRGGGTPHRRRRGLFGRGVL
jgi:hypothetical protein